MVILTAAGAGAASGAVVSTAFTSSAGTAAAVVSMADIIRGRYYERDKREG